MAVEADSLSGPAPDLTGLDQFRAPNMADYDANVSSAEGQLTEARQNLDAQIADVPTAPVPEQFSTPAPQRNIGGLMSMSPWLIALSIFGGSRTNLSANNMLAATTGMVNGLVAGDEQRYQESYDKWQAEHKAFSELQKQKWDVYREMVKVYKDRIDGKQRALQVAEQAVRDTRRDRASSMSAYLQSVRASLALRDEARKWAALDEQIRTHKAGEAIKQGAEAGKTARAGAKTGKSKQEYDDAAASANRLIDDLMGQLSKDARSRGPSLGVTGVGGMVHRGVETLANVTGVSSDTSAHDFETKLSDLQLLVAPLLAKSGRTGKDQREKIEKVVRGLKPGDTRQNTITALKDLKQRLASLPPPDESAGEHGEVVRTGTYNGRKVVQYSDGTVDYAD